MAEKLTSEFNVCKDCTVIDCDTEYSRLLCEEDEGFSVGEIKELIDDVIGEMKAEVEE